MNRSFPFRRQARLIAIFSIFLSATAPVLALERLETLHAVNSDAGSPPGRQRASSALKVYAQLPLRFEENRGQTDKAVEFLARGPGYGVFLTADEAVLNLPAAAPEANATLRMRLVRANKRPTTEGFDRLPTVSNYFVGSDTARWRTNVPNYARIAYRDVYPGIDLVYHGNQRQLEYDFIVSPGADPTRIGLDFKGAHAIDVDENGDLVLSTAQGKLIQRKPLVYQIADGEKKIIAADYRKIGKSSIAFSLAAYDTSQPLIIDPVLSYSTFLGGGNDDSGLDVAVDGAGNAYVTGATQSANFPTANPRQTASAGASDVFVAKINAAGDTLLYSTYLGGSASESGSGIAIDAAGNAYITGDTASADFPTANPLQAALGGFVNAFAVKLSAAGDALVYSTYIGGSGTSIGMAIAVDGVGAAYLTGATDSSNFPVANALRATGNGGFDAFVTKINPAGSAYGYSTYLGGGALDQGMGIAVDGGGNAYVAGITGSSDFPTVNAVQTTFGGSLSDAFVSKLNPAGNQLLYSTYLGGSQTDEGIDIAIDGAGQAYVTGRTASADFPLANPYQANLRGGDDAFVAKLDASGGGLVYSTFLGGSETDRGLSIAVDGSARAYVAGSTDSRDFPTVNATQNRSGGGRGDAFLTRFDATGKALVFSTYLGGSGSGQGSGFTLAFENATGVAVDSAGNAYVVGITNSVDLPTANPVQAAFGGGLSDAYLAKFTAGAATTTMLASRPNPSSAGEVVTLIAAVSGSPPISGFVTFRDGQNVLATVALDGSFKAAFSTSSLAEGNHAISAHYGGDAGNDSSGSDVFAQRVNAAVSGNPSPSSPPASMPPVTEGGGGCTIARNSAFDPLPGLTLVAFAVLYRRRRFSSADWKHTPLVRISLIQKNRPRVFRAATISLVGPKQQPGHRVARQFCSVHSQRHSDCI